jgi:hypothetical protein
MQVAPATVPSSLLESPLRYLLLSFRPQCVRDSPLDPRTLSLLIGLALLLLVTEYLLGLWTNVYAPAVFTTSISSLALGAHYAVGYALGFVALILLIVAVVSRSLRSVVHALIVLLTIGMAGIFGRLYVSSTPNDPVYSFAMGFLFLVALAACMAIGWFLWRRSPGVPARPSPEAPPGPAA